MVDMNQILFPFITDPEMGHVIEACTKRKDQVSALFDKMTKEQFDPIALFDGYFHTGAVFHAMLDAMKNMNMEITPDFIAHVIIRLMGTRQDVSNVNCVITNLCKKYNIQLPKKKEVKHIFQHVAFYCKNLARAKKIDIMLNELSTPYHTVQYNQTTKQTEKMVVPYKVYVYLTGGGAAQSVGCCLIGRFKVSQPQWDELEKRKIHYMASASTALDVLDEVRKNLPKKLTIYWTTQYNRLSEQTRSLK